MSNGLQSQKGYDKTSNIQLHWGNVSPEIYISQWFYYNLIEDIT